MIKQQIGFLKKQIQKLEEKDFDFQSWKSLSIVLLESVFGKNSEKVNQVKQIEFDQSSWTLRDTVGASTKQKNCKKMGREILEIAILELENKLNASVDEDPIASLIVNTLKEELTGRELKRIKDIVTSTNNAQEKKKKLLKELENLSSEIPSNLLVNILINPELIKYLN